MSYSRVILFNAVFLIATNTVAQTPCALNFSGIVSTSSGEPLPGATVLLKSWQTGKVTDAQGYFQLEGLCSGRRYEVVVQFLGYKDQSFEIIIDKDVHRVVTLEQETQRLDEVVVADKHDNIDHVQNISVMNERELGESAGKSLGETLKGMAGVSSIQTGPGIFKPVIHGVHSQRVLILNHGIRQEGQQWGAEHAPEIDPFVASELIIIKDAAAIKYGSDALGGVVIVNPPHLPELHQLGGSLNTIVQSNSRSGTVSGMLEGGMNKVKGLGWRVQGTGRVAGDYSAPDYLLANTGVRELNFSSAVGYHRGVFGGEIFYSHFQTEIGILKGTAVSNMDDLVNAIGRDEPLYTTNDFTYDISQPGQKARHDLLKLNSHITTKSGSWNFQYGFQNNGRQEFDIRSLGVSSAIPAINLRLSTHSVELEWELTKYQGKTLSLGMNSLFQDNENIPGTQRIPFIPNYLSFSGGPFVVGKAQAGKWTVDAGARYDLRNYKVAGRDFQNDLYHSTLNFANASATAGGTYSINASQSFSVNVSSAWRPPHVVELYSFGTHQSAASKEYGLLLNESTNEVMNIDDAGVNVEQALKFVATYRMAKTRFEWEATAYSNLIFNYIYLKPSGITQDLRGAGMFFRYTQTDALFLGADATATWKPAPRWRVMPKVTYLRASDYRNKDYLVFIPSNRAELAVRYESPKASGKPDFYAESSFKYVARQTRAPRVITPAELKEALENDVDFFEEDPSNFDFMAAPDGYLLWNVALGYSIPSARGRYDFRASAENVLNSQYREYTNRLKYFADDIGSNYSLSVKYIF
jgi:iron complex outermembrane receptor protein